MLPPYNPQLAQLVKEPPAGDGWIHEIKLDGYRIRLRDRGRPGPAPEQATPRMDSRVSDGVSAAERLKLDSAFLDGEVAALLPDGRTIGQSVQ